MTDAADFVKYWLEKSAGLRIRTYSRFVSSLTGVKRKDIDPVMIPGYAKYKKMSCLKRSQLVLACIAYVYPKKAVV